MKLRTVSSKLRNLIDCPLYWLGRVKIEFYFIKADFHHDFGEWEDGEINAARAMTILNRIASQGRRIYGDNAHRRTEEDLRKEAASYDPEWFPN